MSEPVYKAVIQMPILFSDVAAYVNRTSIKHKHLPIGSIGQIVSDGIDKEFLGRRNRWFDEAHEWLAEQERDHHLLDLDATPDWGRDQATLIFTFSNADTAMLFKLSGVLE